MTRSIYEDSDGSSGQMVCVDASNPGQKAVTLIRAGVMWGNTEWFYMSSGDVRFPHELSPESACSVWMNTGQLAAVFAQEFDLAGTIRLMGFYDDAVGRTHRSKTTLGFDVDRYA